MAARRDGSMWRSGGRVSRGTQSYDRNWPRWNTYSHALCCLATNVLTKHFLFKDSFITYLITMRTSPSPTLLFSFSKSPSIFSCLFHLLPFYTSVFHCISYFISPHLSLPSLTCPFHWSCFIHTACWSVLIQTVCVVDPSHSVFMLWHWSVSRHSLFGSYNYLSCSCASLFFILII